MSKDQMLWLFVLVVSVVGVLVYGWLLFFSQWAILALQLTCFIAIATVLAIVAWIGCTLATTLLPKPIEEIEKELEQTNSDQK